MRKHGLRALGLSFLAVLGLMAFMAAGAQANFLYLLTVNGAVDDVGANVPTVKAHTPGTLLLLGLNLEIVCQKVGQDTTAPVTLLAASTVAHGHLLFKECETWSVKKEAEKIVLVALQGKCKPWSPGTPKESGEILAGGLAQLLLHEGKNYVLVKPLDKKPFTIIELPETCALAESSEVTGEAVLDCGELDNSVPPKFVGGDCATHRVTQLLQQNPSATLFGKYKLESGVEHNVNQLFFGAQLASIDGIADVLLGAPLEGKAWGGVV